MEKIRTVLVEDERKSLLTLHALLDKYCPDIQVVGTAADVSQSRTLIESLKPELIFLDISLPDGNAFDLLNQIDEITFEIIFITAYNEYALKAFEFSALHYILKPVSHEDLIEAVHRFNRIRSNINISDRLEVLNQSLNHNFSRISLPSSEGLIIIDIDKITRIEASSNYSIFYLLSGESHIVSRSMNYFEKILSDMNFVRIHNTHIVNLDYVRKYNKGRGGMITMEDNTQLTVSAGRKKEFLEKMGRQTFNF
jgi:two-component system LytT family response regulator